MIDVGLCKFCFGSGKLLAKRKAMQFNGPPVDFDEVIMKCPKCNGTGIDSSRPSAPCSGYTEKE